MKTKMILFIICATFFSLGVSAKIKDGKALSGNSLTEFGKYTIVKSDAPMINGNLAIETYDLMYENTRNPIRIGVLKENDCRTFIVKSDEFEVQYTCRNGVFGVKKIEKRFQELPVEANDSKMNRRNYFAQRVISQNQKPQEELLGLIACYFPALVNEEYQANF